MRAGRMILVLTALLLAIPALGATAEEQLTVWAERAGAEIVKHQSGADPGVDHADRVVGGACG